VPGGMSGRDLAEAARRLRPEVKILFASGYTNEVFAPARDGEGGRAHRQFPRQALSAARARRQAARNLRRLGARLALGAGGSAAHMHREPYGGAPGVGPRRRSKSTCFRPNDGTCRRSAVSSARRAERRGGGCAAAARHSRRAPAGGGRFRPRSRAPRHPPAAAPIPLAADRARRRADSRARPRRRSKSTCFWPNDGACRRSAVSSAQGAERHDALDPQPRLSQEGREDLHRAIRHYAGKNIARSGHVSPPRAPDRGY